MKKNLLLKSFKLLKAHFLKKKRKTLNFLKALDFNEARLTKKTLKAFKGKNHEIRTFNPEKNSKIRDFIEDKSDKIQPFFREKHDKIRQENNDKIELFIPEKLDKIRTFFQEKDDKFQEKNHIIQEKEKDDKIRAFIEEKRHKIRVFNEENAVFLKEKMFFEFFFAKKKRLLKKVIDYWGEITKKKWLFFEKNCLSLRLFQRKTLKKSFENLKKYFEIKEKKFLKRRKYRIFSAFLEILRKKLINCYKLLDFRLQIHKTLKKYIFSIFKENTSFYLAFRFKNRQNLIKNTFNSLQKSVEMQKTLKQSLFSFQISQNSQKTLKFFKILKEKTKEKALPRMQRKLALISYKLTIYESFFSHMKKLRKTARKIKKFIKKRPKTEKSSI